MTKKQIALWKQMAELTWRKCIKTCHAMGSCCCAEYCDMAVEYAKEHGVTLERRPGTMFLDDKGTCQVPPHFRPLCTLHQCKIAGLGFDPKDPAWTKKYFDLREKLNEGM
jgi:hypothetical protein